MVSDHLVEVFLPLQYPTGEAVPVSVFDLIKQELTEEFGGVTVYARSPAEGLWSSGGQVQRDSIVVCEVMTPKLDKDWWSAFRGRLEALLRQKEILVRTSRVQRL